MAGPAIDPVFFYFIQLTIAVAEDGIYSPKLCISSYRGYSCATRQFLIKNVLLLVTIVIYVLRKVLRRAKAMPSMHESR